MNVIAIHQMKVRYHGQAAHAAAFPHKGRNALDAAVLGYMNVAALRQHIKPNERIHGIITHGGDKPNIVPSFTAAEWYVRSPTLKSLDRLKPRVVACLEAGAQAAGCELEIEWQDPAYADMVDNRTMLELYTANAAATGRVMIDPDAADTAVVGSTDMGNVSYVVPSIHPMIKSAPTHLSIHTPEFAQYTAGAEGDAAVIDGAKAMAMTVADLWLQPDILAAAKDEFARSVAERRR
jgi:metal-dependent amidase/aminoacylase/carboxypeptidase family protein